MQAPYWGQYTYTRDGNAVDIKINFSRVHYIELVDNYLDISYGTTLFRLPLESNLDTVSEILANAAALCDSSESP